MNSIETATPKEIAKYLQHLVDTAWSRSGYVTDDNENCSEYAHEIWKTLYELIFSDKIYDKLTERFGKLDYYDPDTSYYRDVTAYVDAFKEFAEYEGMFPTFEDFSKDL